jgi:hypothetical protein
VSVGLRGPGPPSGFRDQPLLYVYYTRSGGDIVVARMKANTRNPGLDDDQTEPAVIEHSSVSRTTNGGALAFGPDRLPDISGPAMAASAGTAPNAQNKRGCTARSSHRRRQDGLGPMTACIPSTNPFRGATPGPRKCSHTGSGSVRSPSTGTTGLPVHRRRRVEPDEEVNREPPNYRAVASWLERDGGEALLQREHCNTTGKFQAGRRVHHASGNCSVHRWLRVSRAAYPGLRGLYMAR